MRNHVDARARGRGWRRAGDLRARANQGRALPPCGRLGRDWRSRGGRAGAGRRQRRHPERPRGGALAGARGMRRRHDGARRAHQAVDLPRGVRGLPQTSPRTSVWRSTGATRSWRSSTGATTSGAARRCGVPDVAPRGSGAATSPRHADGSWPTMQAREGCGLDVDATRPAARADRRRRRMRGWPSGWSRRRPIDPDAAADVIDRCRTAGRRAPS